jgi:hypothetical protein
MPINFADVKVYLQKIADNANGDIGGSPHGNFWQGDYNSFINGSIRNVLCNGPEVPQGSHIPIINKNDPINSSFFALLQRGGFCGKTQMPGGAMPGPFITDPAGYRIVLDNGTSVSGRQIIEDIGDWLRRGFPEH